MSQTLRWSLLGGLLLLSFGCPPRSVCGDGQATDGEACDDGNRVEGDGCENDCTATPGSGGGAGGMGGGGGTGGTGGTAGGGGGGGNEARCGNNIREAPEECDDGNEIRGDGCEPSCRFTLDAGCLNNQLDQGEACDDGNRDGGDGCENDCTLTMSAQVVGCPGINLPAPSVGTCDIRPGDGHRLLTGVVLGPTQTLVGGQVLVDPAGTITCVGCQCAQADGGAQATQVICPNGVISPGLINAHDHISFQAPPYVGNDERYEHRHDWRRGQDGHTAVNNGGNASNAQIRWAEVRQVMSGTTSVVGATYSTIGNQGLLRNLDSAGPGQLGINGGTVNSDTFPLGDSGGQELTTSCAYPGMPTANDVPATSSWLPHVSEGIEASAQNEFRCISQVTGLLGPRTALVHGVGVRAGDVALAASTGTSLVWSPRSNVSLYGDTASIPLYARLGANIALGTDWTISGSMNMLRELRCADQLNTGYYNRALTDAQLWRAATAGGADATSTSGKIGRLEAGKLADIAIYRRKATGFHRSVIEAEAQDVVMTMRGGTVLYGDSSLVGAFDVMARCEALEVCGSAKALCLTPEVPTALTGANPGTSLASLRLANASTYPLFFCTAPMNEPSCTPQRTARNVKNNSTTYLGTAGALDSDGDGIPNAMDNCAAVFNPVRPMDNGQQPDVDTDGVGDACDVCPLDANTMTCRMFDPNDLDGDGVPNATDNCPADANPTQLDSDNDLKGDACDSCPTTSNPGASACPVSIYAIKQGMATGLVALGDVLVTGSGSTGFFVQAVPSDTGYMGTNYSGLFVFKQTPGVVAGDRVSIPQGTVANFFGQLQLSGLPVDGGVQVLTAGAPAPTPVLVNAFDVVLNDGGLSAALEGVLVRVENVTVLDINPDAGSGDRAPTNEFVVTGGLRVNDLLHLTTPFPRVGQVFSSITGVLDYRNNSYKLEPRSAADLVAGPAVVTGFDPPQAFVREGSSTVLPRAIEVRLSNAEPQDVTVGLSVPANAGLTLASPTVLVPTGQLGAAVGLTGTMASSAGVVITATLRSSTASTTVRVLGAQETATLASLTPAMVTVAPGNTTRLVVTFDVPVPVATTVTVAVAPATGFATAPAMVVVPADALSAQLDVVLEATATGMGTVTVTAGSISQSTAITAQLMPTASGVVISEFSVVGPGNAAADEFVELYNPGTTAVDVSGWRVQYKSATGATYSTSVTLPGNTSIGPRNYLLIGSAAYTGAVTKDISATTLNFAAAAGHVRLVDDVGAEVDRVAWGSTANQPEGMPIASTHGPDGSFERKASAASTAATMSTGGAEATAGNGFDSQNNAADFVLRPARDPQSSSSPAEP